VSKRYRWICPQCSTGKLLGKAPRKNATARFCIPCSESTGYLVERTCPALDRKRAQKAQSRAVKASKGRAKASATKTARKATEEQRWVVCGTDMRTVIKDLCKLTSMRTLGCTVGVTAARIIRDAQLYSRRSTSGRAYVGSPEYPGWIYLNFDYDDFPAAWNLVQHEVLHAIGFNHGPDMMYALFRTAKEAWDENLDPREFGFNGHDNFGTYNADDVVRKMIAHVLATKEA
jgi:hypothetical protein